MSVLYAEKFNRVDSAAGGVGNSTNDLHSTYQIVNNRLLSTAGVFDTNIIFLPGTFTGATRVRAKLRYSGNSQIIRIHNSVGGAGFGAWLDAGNLYLLGDAGQVGGASAGGIVNGLDYWLSVIWQSNLVQASVATLQHPNTPLATSATFAAAGRTSGLVGVSGFNASQMVDSIIVDTPSDPIAEPAYNIVFIGDSKTRGGFNTVGYSYPSLCLDLLGLDYVGVNLGVDSSTTADGIAAIATYLAAYDATKTNIAVVWYGTNDGYFGADAATIWARQQLLCRLLRAGGFLVVTLSCDPRSNGGTPAGFDATRLAFNGSLRAGWRQIADGFADVAADSRTGDAGDETNTEEYLDLVHRTDMGSAKAAAWVVTAVRAAVATVPPIDANVIQVNGVAIEPVDQIGTETTVEELAAGVVAGLAGQEITISSVVDVTDGDRLNLVRGDDHTEGDRLPTWTILNYAGPSMVGGSCVVRLLRSANWTRVDDDDRCDLQVTATITQVSTTITITAPVTAVQSAALLSTAIARDDTHEYQIIATTSGGKAHTLKLGPTTVLRSIKASS